ncbi:MAG: hypothetical protein ACKVHO_12945 [Verrucomicrobiia bacterium]
MPGLQFAFLNILLISITRILAVPLSASLADALCHLRPNTEIRNRPLILDDPVRRPPNQPPQGAISGSQKIEQSHD